MFAKKTASFFEFLCSSAKKTASFFEFSRSSAKKTVGSVK